MMHLSRQHLSYSSTSLASYVTTLPKDVNANTGVYTYPLVSMLVLPTPVLFVLMILGTRSAMAKISSGIVPPWSNTVYNHLYRTLGLQFLLLGLIQ